MKMKFMAKDVDKSAEVPAQEISDSRWRLKFSDISNATTPSKLKSDSSYTGFTNISDTGRRSFLKQETAEDKGHDDIEGPLHEEAETPEDTFARRQAQREADTASLRKMKRSGITSISGSSSSSKLKRKEIDSNPRRTAGTKKLRT